jgi:hypothetical protein
VGVAHIRRLFRGDARLKILATNMRDGEKMSLHPDNLVHTVSREVRANLLRRFPDGDVTAKDYLVELDTVCFGELPDRHGSSHLLQASSEPVSDEPEWYTTVTKVEHWQRYIDRATLDLLSARARVPLPFAPMGGGLDPALVRILRTIKTGEFIPRLNSTMGYPLVWITPRESFEALVADRDNAAALARDHLGLVHQLANAHLIAMHIPASAVRLVRSNRPTFADAGQHRRFFVWPTEDPPLYAKSWGQTLDLSQLEDFSVLASGGAERVCARIEADHLAGRIIQFEYLGKLFTSRGVSAATDIAFAQHQFDRDELGFSRIVNRI